MQGNITFIFEFMDGLILGGILCIGYLWETDRDKDASQLVFYNTFLTVIRIVFSAVYEPTKFGNWDMHSFLSGGWEKNDYVMFIIYSCAFMLTLTEIKFTIKEWKKKKQKKCQTQ